MGSEPTSERLAGESSDSPSSGSLVSRHLHSVQIQVRALQQEVAALKDSVAFYQDRTENLEVQLRSLEREQAELTERVGSLEESNALLQQRLRRAEETIRASASARDRLALLFAARFEHQQVSIARLARRLQDYLEEIVLYCYKKNNNLKGLSAQLAP